MNFDDLFSIPFNYLGEDLSKINSYIKRNYGKSNRDIHELTSKYVHTDVYPIPESDEKPFFTLVSVGMGSQDMLFAQDDKAAAELVLYLSRSPSGEELLKRYASFLVHMTKFPFANLTFFAEGHTFEFSEEDKKLFPYDGFVFRQSRTKQGKNTAKVYLPDIDRTVLFYDLIPVFQDEFELIHNDLQGFFSWVDKEYGLQARFADVSRKKHFSL